MENVSFCFTEIIFLQEKNTAGYYPGPVTSPGYDTALLNKLIFGSGEKSRSFLSSRVFRFFEPKPTTTFFFFVKRIFFNRKFLSWRKNVRFNQSHRQTSFKTKKILFSLKQCGNKSFTWAKNRYCKLPKSDLTHRFQCPSFLRNSDTNVKVRQCKLHLEVFG